METNRIIFKHWKDVDISYAYLLWSHPQVIQYIGIKEEDIKDRYLLEIDNDQRYKVSYWPIFKKNNEFIGCCGLRPYQDTYECGIHLLPEYWHQGYGFEAMNQIIQYAFNQMHIDILMAGHHPLNQSSKRLLNKLGFDYIRDEYYLPTGLYHPLYIKKSI